MFNSIVGLLIAVLLLATAAAAQVSDKRNFNNVCSPCHGADGRAKTEYGIRNKMPDLHSRQIQSMSDAKIADTIAQGTGHKIYPHSFVLRHVLTNDEVNAIVQEIRAMAK